MSWLIYDFAFNTSTRGMHSTTHSEPQGFSSRWTLCPRQGAFSCMSFMQTMHRHARSLAAVHQNLIYKCMRAFSVTGHRCCEKLSGIRHADKTTNSAAQTNPRSWHSTKISWILAVICPAFPRFFYMQLYFIIMSGVDVIIAPFWLEDSWFQFLACWETLNMEE